MTGPHFKFIYGPDSWTILLSIMMNYHLLAACIGIIIGSIIYFFYFNRLVAYLLGLAFRLSFWNQGASSVWLEIGELPCT